MENEQDSPVENEHESSPIMPLDDTKDEDDDDDGDSTNREYFDTSDRDLEFCAVSSSERCKKYEFPKKSASETKSLEASLEGELDFEEEVHEKDELSKDDIYDECQTSKESISEEKDMDKEKEVKEKRFFPDDDDDDGKITPDKASNDDKLENRSLEEGEDGEISDTRSVEEGEDDGEVSDQDDLEEGEVKDAAPTAKPPTRQVCRFFNRGQCTWGTLCRFLHLSVNERGHYNMFEPTRPPAPFGPGNNGMGIGPPPVIMSGPAHMGQRGGPRSGPDFLPPPPPPHIHPVSVEPPPAESAWERGLRHAKELMKKASRRKEQEPDFEEKRLNLSIDENDRIISEYDKENEYIGKSPYRRQSESQSHSRFDDANDGYDNGEREAREHWRGGRYENFEIRWTRQDLHNKDRREKDRTRNTRMSEEREKPTRRLKGKERWRDDRLSEIQTRSRADEWRDPWRRSKTPKGRRSRSRGRSRGSYSSVSSHSYTDRSSHSSYSYSRSSSRSSYYSSGSVSPNRPAQSRKITRRKNVSPPQKVSNRGLPLKRRQIPLRRSRSHSYSRSHSSHSISRSRSSSSRSHSVSRSPSASRSRSYSRSLSMSSVSSASSSVTHSSSGSDSPHERSMHTSVLRKNETKIVQKTEAKNTSRLLDEVERLKEYEKMRERDKEEIIDKIPNPSSFPSREKKLLEEPIKPVHCILPVAEKIIKEPMKHSGHKQQIKLTLLNKALSPKVSSIPKRDLDSGKTKQSEKEETIRGLGKAGSGGGIKRPLSPSPLAGKAGVSAPPKRSTSSRREELLKQLKAVEDAIARKRAKFS